MSADMSPYCSAHDELLIMKRNAAWFNLQMRDGAIHDKLYVLKLTMAVDNIVLRIIKGAFDVHINLLCMCFYTIPSNGRTSLSTAVVIMETYSIRISDIHVKNLLI